MPEVSERSSELPKNIVADRSRNDDAPRLRNTFEAGGDIYGRPEQVAILVNDISGVNADADLKLLLA